MIDIKISVTSIDECIELMEKLKNNKIKVEFNGAYKNPIRATLIKRKRRQDKILEITKTWEEFDVKTLRKHLMNYSIKETEKTLKRDLFDLENKGLIRKNMIKKEKGGFKNVYKITN
jgi:hypothetical protein